MIEHRLSEDLDEEETEPDWERYVEAAFMALDHQPITVEAKSLCEDVAGRIEAWEHTRKKRSYGRRRNKRKQFREAVGLVIGDLLAGPEEERPRQWLYRPMAPDEFTDEPVSSRAFQAIFGALRGLALIEVQPGYFSHAEGECQHGRCTRLRSSRELLDLAERHGVDLKETKQHFHRQVPAKPSCSGRPPSGTGIGRSMGNG